MFFFLALEFAENTPNLDPFCQRCEIILMRRHWDGRKMLPAEKSGFFSALENFAKHHFSFLSSTWYPFEILPRKTRARDKLKIEFRDNWKLF